MNTQAPFSPTEAQDLLNRATTLSKQSHDAVKWPYISFILALGIITAFGSLAMTLTEGASFGLAYTATLTMLFALLMFFLATTREKRAFAWSKRWAAYIVSWAVAYAGAIAVVGFMHGSVIWAAATSGLILLVTFFAATIEARR